MTNSISTLIGEEHHGRWKWSASILGADGCIYGIPNDAHRVVRYNPFDQTFTEFGPDLGNRSTKWMGGTHRITSKIGYDLIYVYLFVFVNVGE